MQPKTLIVILNYRTADLTIQCLRSLVNQIVPDQTQVVVVDNCSEDDSVAKIRSHMDQEKWQSWVTLLESKENRGYAAGNNLAIRSALEQRDGPKYILILNPDTIVRKGAIEALTTFMEMHPKAGIAGSRLENLEGIPQSSAFRFPTVMSEFDGGLRLGVVSKLLNRWRIDHDISEEPHRADWLSGASFMVRTEVFKDVGLFDEGYFLYFEELDFCLKVYRGGWECWVVPQSRVMHLVGQSTGFINNHKEQRRPVYWFDSRRRYFQKNFNRAYAIIVDLIWMLGFALWRIRRVLQRKPDLDPPHMLSDFFCHSSLFRGINENSDH